MSWSEILLENGAKKNLSNETKPCCENTEHSMSFNGRTMWRSSFSTKKALNWRLRKQKKHTHWAMQCEEDERQEGGGYFQDCVSEMTTVAPLTLHSFQTSLSNPAFPPALNLRASNAVNFSNHRPFSPSLCASHDKYRTVLSFPSEQWHTCVLLNHVLDHTVYKGHGRVTAGERENKRHYWTQTGKQTERNQDRRAVCVICCI